MRVNKKFLLLRRDESKTSRYSNDLYVRGMSDVNSISVSNTYFDSDIRAYVCDSVHGIMYDSIHFFIPKNSIVFYDGKLSDGYIRCRKHNVEQRNGIVTYRNQQFFRIVQSSVEEIPENSYVITVQHSSVRAILGDDYEVDYFIHKSSVILIVSDDGYQSGENYELLTQSSPIRSYHRHGSIIIGGCKYDVVKKNSIFAYE
jgi:hypothetical protein